MMLLSYFMLGLTLFTAPVQSQVVRVTWNGSNITGPVLIYHDELLVDMGSNYTIGNPDRPGALMCRSERDGIASWRLANGNFFNDVNNRADNSLGLQQIRTNSNTFPSLSRLSKVPENRNTSAENLNGLWSCRTDIPDLGSVYVGLFYRTEGAGAITSNVVSLSPMSSFESDPPTFTLFGNTSGGPPVEISWLRDGMPISNEPPFNITLGIAGNSGAELLNSSYLSTLTVTGEFPGVYEYTANNSATATPGLNGSFSIEGTQPTMLEAEQTGLQTVTINWTAPIPPPQRGYRLTARSSSGASREVVVTSSPHHMMLEPGDYNVELTALSQHFTSEPVGPEEVTVRGQMASVIVTPSPTATSVTITWTQPEFSLPVSQYRVTLTRVTGSGLCPSVVDLQQVTVSGSTASFMGLQEFSAYSVEVNATFSAFGEEVMIQSMMEFTTLTAAPTGAPEITSYSTTPTTITVSWTPIECIERNGMITNYSGMLVGGPGEVNLMDRTLTASGLTPHTNYTFRVAGVNSAGTGPFTDIILTTAEEVPGVVSNLMARPKFSSIVLTWGAPQEPNGIIISYEVTYRGSDGNLVTTNTTNLSTTFTIPSLTPGINVTNISVSAYTAVGQGEEDDIEYVMTLLKPPMVTNVEVEVTSASSVRVSWDILDIPEIVNYRVYYSRTGQEGENTTTVPSSADSVEISGLLTGEEYQFQVVAVADLDGNLTVGQRSNSSVPEVVVQGTNQDIVMIVAIAIGATFFALLVLLMLLFCCACYKYRQRHRAVKNIDAYKYDIKLRAVSSVHVEQPQQSAIASSSAAAPTKSFERVATHSSEPVPIPGHETIEEDIYDNDVVLGVTEDTESAREMYDVPTSRYHCGVREDGGLLPDGPKTEYDVPVNSHKTLESPPSSVKKSVPLSPGIVPPRTVQRRPLPSHPGPPY